MEQGQELTVFVVRITSRTLHPEFKVGAVYLSEDAAIRECQRLRDANPWTKADYVPRTVG